MYYESELGDVIVPPEFLTMERMNEYILMQTGLSIEQVEAVRDAEKQYRAKFYHKCRSSFCPTTRAFRAQVDSARKMLIHSGTNYSGNPGFATKHQLEVHREMDHDVHTQGHWNDNFTGSITWFECACGHTDNRYNDSDDPRYRKDNYPVTRIAHLRRVLCFNPDAKISDDDWKHL